MFALIYVKNGEVIAHEEKFENALDAEKKAKEMKAKDFRAFPVSTEKIDLSKGKIDF